jgi:hypothetical protein
MKKLIIIAIILSFALMLAGFIHYEETVITIRIDGNDVVFDQSSGFPFIDDNGRTQVPFRKTLEAFGAAVDWDNEFRTAIAIKDGITVRAPIGTEYIYKDDEKIINDTRSMVKDGRTYLPIRVVLEAFDADVDWDNASKTVIITSAEIEESEIELLVKDMLESASAVSSMNVSMAANVRVERGGTSSYLRTDMKASSFYDPLKVKYTGNVTRWGGRYTADLFMVSDDGKCDIYHKTGSKYEIAKQFVRIPYVESVLSSTLINLIPQFEYNSDTHVNGKRVMSYKGIITQQQLVDILSPSDGVSLAVDGFDYYQMNVLMSANPDAFLFKPDYDVPDIKVTVYIDPESKLIVRYTMDLLPVYKELFSRDKDIVVKSASYEVNVSDVNKVKDFNVPAEIPLNK